MKAQRIDARCIVSICIFLISIFYLYAAKDLVLGTMKKPGVGFLPVLAGTLLAIFSVLEIGKSQLSQNEKIEFNVNWGKIGLLFLAVVLYAGVLNLIGYQIATFGLLLVLAKLFGVESWLKPIIFAALISFGSYYLFAEILLVPLP